MANVCLGCNDVEDIHKCPNGECPHYEFRDRHLAMDDEVNDKRTALVKRTSREIMMYKPGGSSLV